MADPKVEAPLQRVLAMRHGDWFRAVMDEYYERSEAPRVDPGWFHPSALSNPCDAYLAFSFLGVTPRQGTVDSRRRRIFDNGHSTEGRWQTAIAKAGLAQVKTEGDRRIEIRQWRIRGELDNVVANPLTGEQYVWDCKTMREDYFERLDAPLASWVVQMHPYMFARGVLQSLVTVECKNCQDYKNFTIAFDGALWKAVTDRLEMIMERLGQRLEVARTPQLYESQCEFYGSCALHDFSKAVTR